MTSLACTARNRASKLIKHDMLPVSEYYETNRLVLNVGKSKVMFFGRRSNREFNDEIVINGSVLERVTCYKYLGLMLDSDLSFKRHIDLVAARISSIVGMIFRIRGFVPRHVLINLYFSLIHSNLIYLLEVYGSAAKTALNRLEVLQRRALKLIFNLPRLTPTNQLYNHVKSLGIIPLKAQYYLATAAFAWKITKGRTHCNIALTLANPSRRTRHTRRYRHYRVNSNAGRRMFLFNAQPLGNRAFGSYHSLDSIGRLKSRMRTFLCENLENFSKVVDCSPLG